ncbi:hypothetical protein H6F98_12015 [Microcoleus sp. FACHB-SPT15]|uniref:hypothetical protein n=1 Tax=Microcoleus sp. FACHB-SPT15 TaxID=2692830 RepID=UPI0017818162|nr:hypothetical protein [Microcoleus sp. FACHB-SPT15]MBD1806173.1 hypothetical protein [Microcoleus sp. FACHB-SPT15]
MTKTIPLAQPSSPVHESQSVLIPKHLPPIVRDVAKSLALRDRISAERYLAIHFETRRDGQ